MQAAQNGADQIRLIAGPGTGKSAAIERRVAHLLSNGTDPSGIFVISFTRATCAELEQRITAFCANQPFSDSSTQIHLSTMHSLALRLLRSANVLATLYPDDPTVIDEWETKYVYDSELAIELGCPPGRAKQVREAHDTQWQTLDPASIAQSPISDAEVAGFNIFHAARRNLYCCVLPGEMIYECVHRLQQGAIQLDQLPPMDHLVVDEFQDLNACDQEFIQILVSNGAKLFVAGDDDQSIYSFRHADPTGIIRFNEVYPAAKTQTLEDCFRCTPTILNAASTLIGINPDRISKKLHSLYESSSPPVTGTLHVWSFPNAQQEATAIAESCQQLIAAGMAGQEDEIIILISNRRLQLNLITQELGNLGLPFDPPTGAATKDQDVIRAAYSMLRIVKDLGSDVRDYLAHRDLLSQLYGIGGGTAKEIADQCVTNNQNFRALFYLPSVPTWLSIRSANAVTRVKSIIEQVAGWNLQDTVGARTAEIEETLSSYIFNGSSQIDSLVGEWVSFASSMQPDMLLGELLQFLAARDEAEQRQILESVIVRLGIEASEQGVPERRIRILTMHGAKGLGGKVVFIPAVEQGIMPSFRAIQAVGLLNEQRRLYYVSLTRARAACLISHAAQHTGAEAFLIQQKPNVRLPRSQFLNEMAVTSANRSNGLSVGEAAKIMADLDNL